MTTFERMSMPLSYIVGSANDFHPDEIAALDIYNGIRHDDFPDDINDIEEPLFRHLLLLEKFDDQSCFIGRDENGEICAVASVDDTRTDGTLWVNGIAVHPDSRGQGTGHDFCGFLADIAKAQGKSRLGGRALASSLGFHLSEGFYVADDNPDLMLVYKDL